MGIPTTPGRPRRRPPHYTTIGNREVRLLPAGYTGRLRSISAAPVGINTLRWDSRRMFSEHPALPHTVYPQGMRSSPEDPRRYTGVKNVRYHNGNARRKYRERFKTMQAQCGICKGRLGPIHYDEPSDSRHPLSFVIDEIKPVSRWKEFGYDSPEAAVNDWNNLQAAHYCCNAAKSNRVPEDDKRMTAQMIARSRANLPDGDW